MLTSVRSLIAERKTEEARQVAVRLRGTSLWEQVKETFKSLNPAACRMAVEGADHHRAEWQWVDERFAWLEICRTCKERDDAYWKSHIEEIEQEELERKRPHRHLPPERLIAALTNIGVPARFRSATVKRLEPLTDSLYLTGPRGTGKTHMAAAIIREIVLDKTPSHSLSGLQWTSAPDLLLEIRATFRDGSERSEKEIIEQYSNCKLLVLDDLGAEKTSGWSLQTLYTIIDRRYREERQTIITSNLSLDELAAQVDDRIASRLSELCRVVVLTGRDRRVKGKS